MVTQPLRTALVLLSLLALASGYIYNSCRRDEMRKNLQFMKCCADRSEVPIEHSGYCNYTLFFDYVATQAPAPSIQHNPAGVGGGRRQTICSEDVIDDGTNWAPLPQRDTSDKMLSFNNAIFQCMAKANDNSDCCTKAHSGIGSTECIKLCKPKVYDYGVHDYVEHRMMATRLKACAPYFETILQCHYDSA